MTELYDVLIIGASCEGIKAYNCLKKANKNIKQKVISTNFNHCTSGNSILKADRIQGTVFYESYIRGILEFVVKTDSGDEHFYAKTAILATGTTHTKSAIKSNNVVYAPEAISARSVNTPIVITGYDDYAVKSALKLSNKYNHIYFCCEKQWPECEIKYLTELMNTDSIAYLPLCTITAIKSNKAGELAEVKLSTNENLKCNYILASTKRVPDTKYCRTQLCALDEEGYLLTTENNALTTLPIIYAIGNCTKNYSEDSLVKTVADILKKVGVK